LSKHHAFRTTTLCAVFTLTTIAFAAKVGFERDELVTTTPEAGEVAAITAMPAATTAGAPVRGTGLRLGWPVSLSAPGAGFPYTPTLADIDGDGDDEIFLTGGDTFGLDGDGSFLPGWPTAEHLYMGYGTNGAKPGPSVADLDRDGVAEVVWTERDWWAGSSAMWCFNGRYPNGTDLPNFPQFAPGDYSNALDTPFVVGDTDGDGELEAWSAHTLGNTFTHYRISAFDADGTKLFTTDLDPNENVLSLYFGDVDGNGAKEMFGVSWLAPDYRLQVFEDDGSVRVGYPVTLYSMPAGGYSIFGPPVVADLDLNGDLEFLHGYNQSGNSKAVGVHHDGSAYSGFPFTVASSSQLFYVGLGDVTGDGTPELLALDNHLGAAYRAFAIDLSTGGALPGWPVTVPDWPKSFPCVADVDGDGVQDISFVTDGGELWALTGAGAAVAGFPRSMVSPSISGVAVGDIDGDGLFEMVAATWDGWVYAWDTVSPVSHADWPMRGINARNTGVYGDDGTDAASCAWYCGSGSNIDSYTIATGYLIGATFQGTVGFTGPNVGAVIAGYLGQLTFPVWGQQGLVDVTKREVMGLPSGIGSSPVTITWGVPNQPAYAGMHVFTQAAGFGGGVINLTCAYDCAVGY
jgi:hypothetical protein